MLLYLPTFQQNINVSKPQIFVTTRDHNLKREIFPYPRSRTISPPKLKNDKKTWLFFLCFAYRLVAHLLLYYRVGIKTPLYFQSEESWFRITEMASTFCKNLPYRTSFCVADCFGLVVFGSYCFLVWIFKQVARNSLRTLLSFFLFQII